MFVERFWWRSHQKLIELIYSDTMVSQILTNLLLEFASEKSIVSATTAVIGDPTNYDLHQQLKRAIIKCAKHEHLISLAYFDEYHEFMYELQYNWKVWYKPGTWKKHCTKTFINDDGLVETYPAVVSKYVKKWFQDGEYHRTDRDKYGNRLPTDIQIGNGTFWEYKSILHRFELGNDPNSPYYRQALPAKIFLCGEFSWKFMGREKSRDEITKRLLVLERYPALKKLWEENEGLIYHELYALLGDFENIALRNILLRQLAENGVAHGDLFCEELHAFDDSSSSPIGQIIF